MSARARSREGLGLARQTLFLGGLIFAVFGLSFWAPFDYDDVLMIAQNQDVVGPWQSWRHFLLTPFSYQENYEPVSSLLHRAAFLAGGLSPALFRLENLLLHWLACVLVLRLLQEMLGPRAPSLWLAALFAVYPSHTENIAIATFKKHILVAICGLTMLLIDKPWREDAPSWSRRAACAGFLALGLFCKENAAVLPAILAAMSLSLAPDCEKRLRRDGLFFAGLFGVDLAFLFWRSRVVPRPLAQLVGGSPVTHLLTAAKCLTWYLREFLLPVHLVQEHSIAPLSASWSWALAGTLAALAALVALGAWLWRKDRVAFAGLALAVLWIVPFLNLIPYLNLSLVANRYIYLSMAGVLLCAGELARPFWELKAGRLRAVPLACAAVGLAYSGLAMTNLARYSDPLEVWERAARYAPGNPRAHTALASLYASRQRFAESEREFRDAAKLGDGGFALSSVAGLAMLYAETGRVDKAGRLYRALGFAHLTSVQYQALGETLLRQGRRKAAMVWFRTALRANPRDYFSRFKLASCYAMTKDDRRAEIQWKSLTGDSAVDHRIASLAFANLGLLYARQKRPAQAQAAYEKALGDNPSQVGVAVDLAELYAKQGEPGKGLALLDKLIAGLRAGQREAFASADDFSRQELRDAVGALPRALALRAKFLAKYPPKS